MKGQSMVLFCYRNKTRKVLTIMKFLLVGFTSKRIPLLEPGGSLTYPCSVDATLRGGTKREQPLTPAVMGM